MSEVHHVAAAGFQAEAATYAAGRPDYPAEITDWLQAELGLTPGEHVLDLGAGTGKFTDRLIETGADVVAVEPVAAMRREFAARHPAVACLDGTARHIPLADASLDAVACAQAFHWFADPEALAEIHRVLKPGGTLGFIWNVRDESVAWVRAVTEIITPYEGDAPRFHNGAWKRVFPAEGFGPLVERRFPHGHTGRPETVIVDRILSVSFIAALPAHQRAAVAARLRAVVAAAPELAGRDIVTFPYRTVAYACRRL